MNMRRFVLICSSVLIILAGLVFQSPVPALAYDVIYNTSGAMVASTSSNSQSIYKDYTSPSGNEIKRVHVTFSLRPATQGGSTTNDRVYLYYKTCSSCSWTSQGYVGAGELTYDGWVDVEVTTAEYVRLRLYTGTGYTGATATANFPEVVIDDPPYALGAPSFTTTASAQWQQAVTWSAGSNPGGTTYEVWRKTFNTAGNLVSDQKVGTSNSTSWTSSDHVQGTYYEYYVKPVYGGRVGPASPTAPVWSAPSPVVTSANDSLVLNWTPAYPNTTYTVQYKVSTSSTWSSVNVTGGTYTISGLNPAYKYNVQLLANLPSGGDEWAAPSSGGTEFSPLWEAVGGVEKTNEQPTSVKLWVMRGSLSSSAQIKITRNGSQIYLGTPSWTSTSVNGTSGYWFSVDSTGLTVGTPYTYSICAVNAMGACGPASTLSHTPQPNTPTAISLGTGVGTTYQAALSWGANGNPGGTQYEVWRRTWNTSGSATDAKITPASFTGTSFTTTDQVAGKLYTYRVRAIISGITGPFSEETPYATAPDRTVTSGAGNLTVSWPDIGKIGTMAFDGGSVTDTSTSSGSVTSPTYTVPNGMVAGKARVQFSGGPSDSVYLRYTALNGSFYYAYRPATGDDQAGVSSFDEYFVMDQGGGAVNYYIYAYDRSSSTETVSVVALGDLRYPINVEYRPESSGTYSLAATTTSLSYTIPNLSPAVRYGVRLYADVATGDTWVVGSGWSSPLWNAVTGTSSEGPQPTSHSVYWNIRNSGVAASATIRVTRNGSTIYEGVPTYAAATVGGTLGDWASVASTGLSVGTTYNYSVCAVNAVGTCGPVKTLSYAPQPNVPGVPVLSSSTTGLTQYNLSISWNANGNPAGTVYELNRKTFNSSGGQTADTRINPVSSTASTFITTGQTGGTYCTYRTRAIVNGVPSPWSAEVPFYTAPMPTVTKAVNSLTVSWPSVYPGAPTPSGITLTDTSSGSGTVYSPEYTVAPGKAVTKARVVFSGNVGDDFQLEYVAVDGASYVAYFDGDYYDVGVTAFDQWIDLSQGGGAVSIKLRAYRSGSATTTATLQGIRYPTDPAYNLFVLKEGDDSCCWTQVGSDVSGATFTIPDLSPSFKYRVVLAPIEPSGGVGWWVNDGTYRSPYWPQPQVFLRVSETTTTLLSEWVNDGIEGAKVRITRDGAVVWNDAVPAYTFYASRNGQSNKSWAGFNDVGLASGSTHTYVICAVNAEGQCGTTRSFTASTLPNTPAQPSVQYGSYGWKTSAAGNGWAVVEWTGVSGATGYKLYLDDVPTDVGLVTSYSLPALNSGQTYSVEVSAVNDAGETPLSASRTFSTPNRADSTAPTISGSILINDGAATTGGTRVRVSGSASDAGSGVYGIQLSSNGTTWGSTIPIRTSSTVNQVVLAGGSADFSNLAGWDVTNQTAIWADQGTVDGDKSAIIRWRGNTSTSHQGLHLSTDMAVTPGETYTVSIRYKIEGMTAGTAGVWSHFKNSSGGNAQTADIVLGTANTGWRTETVTQTAPLTATKRHIYLGFVNANPGAVLTVGWIMVNVGPNAAPVTAALDNPIVGTGDFELDTTAFGTKTVHARFVDLVGNVSVSSSDTIQFLLTDTSGPRVTMQINGGAGITSTADVTLSIVATDDQSPPSGLKMRLSNDGVSWSSWMDFSPTKAWKISTLGEGEKAVWIEVQDEAKNSGGTVARVFYRTSMTPGTNPAVVSASVGSSGQYNTGTGTVQVQYVRLTDMTIQLDPASLPGVQTVRYGFDPNRYGQWEPLQSTKSLNLPNVEGIQTLYVQTDTGQQFQLKILLDRTAPDVQVSWGGGATMTRAGGQATLVVDAFDNLSRNEDLQVSINSGTYVAWSNEISVTLTGTGLKNVTVRVKDPAGNVTTKTLSIFAIQ